MHLRGTRRWTPTGLVLIAVTAIFAGTLAARPAQASTAAPAVQGVVTGADGSGPIAGIEVCASQRTAKGVYTGAGRCTETAADGTYAIRLSTGLYSFNAYEPTPSGSWVKQNYAASKAYSISATTIRTANFALVRGATIGVAVAPPEGGPTISRVRVYAYLVDSAGRAASYPSYWADSGEDGIFRITQLPAGTYKLRVADGASPAAFRNQWYPAASTASAAERVTVETGQTVVLPTMPLTKGGTVKINLRKPDGSVDKLGNIEVFDADGRLIWEDYQGTPSDHTVNGLYPGSYKVRATPYLIPYREWFSWKTTFARANPIVVTSGATNERTLTFHYPTIKATKRPVMRLDANSIEVSHAKWNVKPRYVRYEWWRDGKLIDREGFDWRLARKIDVGHRFKVCQIADRSGYAEGRTCSSYSKKVKKY